MKKPFWSGGIRFECQGSGKCCTSRGSFGFVYLSLEDRRRMARHFNLRTSSFTQKYCEKTGGLYHLKESKGDCRFLKGTSCSVYHARPAQCRTWPFWPENMNARSWNREVTKFCPGVGKGPVHTEKEIEAHLKNDLKFQSP